MAAWRTAADVRRSVSECSCRGGGGGGGWGWEGVMEGEVSHLVASWVEVGHLRSHLGKAR